MGIIAGLLVAAGYLREFAIPLWVILAAHAAIALGTLTGGWRIVHTMGSKITKLQPFGGFAAETAGAMTLFGASSFGIPVSTTHTITGAIIGVGRSSAFRRSDGASHKQIVWAWILTIPASAIIAALTYRTLSLFGFR
jgi:PiT family inorganic phosphate transporter